MTTQDTTQSRPLQRRFARAWRAAAVCAAPALLLLLAACGAQGPGVASLGPATSTGSPSASGGSGSKGQNLEAFSQCMRQHGITRFPDPQPGGGLVLSSGMGFDPSSPQFQAAQSACQHLLPGGGPQPLNPQQQAAMEQQALQFSQCMRQHGISDFPDPQFSSSGGRVGVKVQLPSSINPSSPQFQAAQSACQHILANGGKGQVVQGAGPGKSGGGGAVVAP